MRLPIIGLLLWTLASCASPTSLTPAQRVYELKGQLDIALEQVEAYAAQPPCDPDAGIVVRCHEVRVVMAAIEAAEEADAALDQAEAVVRLPGATDQDIALYVATARAALDRLARELAKGSSS